MSVFGIVTMETNKGGLWKMVVIATRRERAKLTSGLGRSSFNMKAYLYAIKLPKQKGGIILFGDHRREYTCIPNLTKHTTHTHTL